MKKRKKNNTSKLMILLSFMLMIIIFIYIILNSNLFNSSNVKIEGNKRISNKEIIKMLDIREDKNIFRYNIKQMEKYLIKNRYIESAEIKRKIPNKLQILIIEKEIPAVIKDGDDYCYIDNKGNLIQKINELDTSEQIIVVETKYNLTEDKRVEFKNEETKKRLLYLLECINENNLYKKINKINFKNNEHIYMHSNEGVNIIVANDNKIDYNIAMVSAILSDLQGKHIKGGTIDLACGNNPIYKPKKLSLDKE